MVRGETSQKAMAISADFGWHVTDKPDRMFAESVQSPTFGFGRVWSSASENRLISPPNLVHVIANVEGPLVFRHNGEELELAPGELVLLPGGSETFGGSSEDCARYAWYCEPTHLSGSYFRSLAARPIPISRTVRTALFSLANGYLNSEKTQSATVLPHLAQASEHLLAIALTEHDGLTGRPEREHQDYLFSNAQRTIEQHFRDPAFSVARLAKALDVSERTLRRAYASLGITPQREIQRRRLAEASRLLNRDSTGLNVSFRSVAEASGFSSAQHLRRTLLRHENAPAPEEPANTGHPHLQE